MTHRFVNFSKPTEINWFQNKFLNTHETEGYTISVEEEDQII